MIGLDKPLLALTADDARAMVDPARPMVARFSTIVWTATFWRLHLTRRKSCSVTSKSTVLPIPLDGWDLVVTAMNLDTWNGIDADTQALISSQIVTGFEDLVWAINRKIALLVGVGLLACAAFVLTDIVMRRFGTSRGGTEEIAGLRYGHRDVIGHVLQTC